MIRLYDYWRSSAAYRVRIALNLKGLVYESVPVNLLSAEHTGPENLARNPQGLVPTLEIDGATLTQSVAIIDYLDATRPDPPLLPKDPLGRARVLASALAITSDVHPIANLRVLKRLETQFGADQAAKEDWYRHWVQTGFDALETIAGAEDGPFLDGPVPGLADICLVPQMYNARRFEMNVDAWPNLVAIDDACTALPAFAAAHPDCWKP